jgi:2-polyprenyl-3-methyl-5-hydroxy-6-metoxy-1,4-benzoquinol methylase
MIGIEFQYGQGLGNQLLSYVTLRCLAMDLGLDFGTLGRGNLGDKRYSIDGLHFMNLDLGLECSRSDFKLSYQEKSRRLFLQTCEHDMTRGCDISIFDEALGRISDGTLISGILQAEKYFAHHRSEITTWLTVKPEFDVYDFSAEDMCVINMRGGEYVGHPELFLGREYWLRGIENMKRLIPKMRFIVVTEDVPTAQSVLPEIPAHDFGMAKDYALIKNASYLILSNSSFAVMPSFASETLRYAIAPKYWARHNVSDGYWSTGQNIYSWLTYQDRDGRLFTSEHCAKEFDEYQKVADFNTKLSMSRSTGQFLRVENSFRRATSSSVQDRSPAVFTREDSSYRYDFDSHDPQEVLRDEAGPLGVIANVLPESATVLDIGCGNGILGWLLRFVKPHVVADGIEPNPYAAGIAGRHYRKVYTGTAEQFISDIGTSKYDYLIMADVLEHIANPLSLLQSLLENTPKEIKIILSIPNVAHYSVRLALLNGRFQYVDSGLLERTHLRFFTLETIENLAAAVGLNIESTYFLERDYYPDAKKDKLRLGLRNYLRLINDRTATAYQYVLVLGRERKQREEHYLGKRPNHSIREFAPLFFRKAQNAAKGVLRAMVR